MSTIAVPTIPAAEWNKLRAITRRNRALSGANVRLHWSADGVIISAAVTAEYTHPWQLSCRWKVDESIQPAGGLWAATVEPGFVNGRDVFISTKRDEQLVDVALTDEEPPELEIRGWRDPTQPQGASATLDLDLIVQGAEGYPPFFDSLGVKPAARGGKGFAALEGESDPNRTRQIRAVDVVLITPRVAARQQVDVLNPLIDQQAVQISTAFSNNALRHNPHHRIGVFGKWQPPQMPTALDRLMGAAAEPELDELLLATIYVVSPPDYPDDAKPDASWTAYPRYFVFWNLAHANRNQVPQLAPKPITFFLPLAGGVAQPIISALLTPVNDAAALIYAYLDSADFSGKFWAPSGIGFETTKRPQPTTAAAVKTGLNPLHRRIAREAKAAVENAPPPLNPPFPFRRLAFDPWFFVVS
ncbi:MAG: hypothetical protein ABMA13_18940 [Chthoniobacteraceae bacterium]